MIDHEGTLDRERLPPLLLPTHGARVMPLTHLRSRDILRTLTVGSSHTGSMTMHPDSGACLVYYTALSPLRTARRVKEFELGPGFVSQGSLDVSLALARHVVSICRKDPKVSLRREQTDAATTLKQSSGLDASLPSQGLPMRGKGGQGSFHRRLLLGWVGGGVLHPRPNSCFSISSTVHGRLTDVIWRSDLI